MNANNIAKKVYLADHFIFLIELWISKIRHNNDTITLFNFIDFLNQLEKTKILKRIEIMNDELFQMRDLFFCEKIDENTLKAKQQLDYFFNKNRSLDRCHVFDKCRNNMDLLPINIINRNIGFTTHNLLLNYCISFLPLQLPPYVMLEIFDWLPDSSDEYMSHFKKIELIVKIVKFYKERQKIL